MNWLKQVVEAAIAAKPAAEIIVESGVSPSGAYHVGTLREVLTSDAVLKELKNRGRPAKHIHYVDDMDVFRKVPANVPASYDQYLGKPYFLIFFKRLFRGGKKTVPRDGSYPVPRAVPGRRHDRSDRKSPEQHR
jgi:hypothetical protein